MASTTKKIARPTSPRRKAKTNRKPFSLAPDEAERMKIGKTLNVAAFKAHLKKTATATQKYWETPE